MQNQPIPASEPIAEPITVQEDLSAYLDSDPDAQPITREEYIDPEAKYDEQDHKRFGLKDPRIKTGLTIGGILAVMFVGSAVLNNASNSNQVQVAKADPKDKQIAELRNQIKTMHTESEDAIADRQAKEYGIKKPGTPTKPSAANSASGSIAASSTGATYSAARPVARTVSSDYVSELPQSRPIRFTPRTSVIPASYSAPRVAAAPASQGTTGNARESQLQKRIDELQARLAQMEKKRSEVVASVPEATVQEVPEGPIPPESIEQSLPQPSVQNVAAVNPDPVAQFDGGIEEVALMRGQPVVTIAAGSQSTAQLDLPIYQGAQQARVLATMTSDLTDRNGSVVIEKGAKLLGYASFNGDFVSVAFESAVVNGQAVTLPGAAIAVLAENKQPLIAKSFSGSGGASFGKTFASVALNGVSSGIGQLLQPSTSTVINGSSTIASSTSSGNTLGNAGLAALGGISNGVSNGLQAEIQRSGQVQVSAKGIKSGSTLRLVFTADTQILSPLVMAAVPYPG